ncbi:MAG: hypothetical protein JW946_04630, partial [Candidatus Omnitrophica bacterium]|nr:hypothetical protein [Candidatus Omnitrophota bacterium]
MKAPFPDLSIKKDFTPIAVLCILIATFILISFKIISLGYTPPDDTLRHVGKVISGKDWHDILVLRKEIVVDSHPGWHALLGLIYRIWHPTPDLLIVFSVCFLFLLFTLVPLFILKYPEAWMISLLIISVANPYILARLFSGRPYILTMSVIAIICFLWRYLEDKKTALGTFLLFIVLICVSTWVHCAWYLYILPVFCFFAARKWRAGGLFAAATIIGIAAGATLTGKPLVFLNQTFTHAVYAFSNNALQRMLVTEFQSFIGDNGIVIAVLGALAWRYMRGAWNRDRVENPVFILLVTGWILGFVSRRFWMDWGIPAFSVWLALEFDEHFGKKINFLSWGRVTLALITGLSFYLSLTNDTDSRWTNSLGREYLSLNNPDQAEWLPEKGGIIYSDNMRIFYDTFFTNPRAPWKYILGFEPTQMPPDDLAVFRQIQWNYGAYEAFKP